MKPLPIILFLFFCSCSTSSPEIKVKNNTEKYIDSVVIGNSFGDMARIESLKPGGSKSTRLIFSENAVGEGGYVLNVYNNGILIETFPFGYYTGGKSLNKKFEIEINAEGIQVR